MEGWNIWPGTKTRKWGHAKMGSGLAIKHGCYLERQVCILLPPIKLTILVSAKSRFFSFKTDCP